MARRSREELAIPMVHASLLVTFVDFLCDIGAPVERAISRAHLPTWVAEAGAGFVPCRNFCDFVDNESRSQAIEEIGLVVSGRAGVDAIETTTWAAIVTSPTLVDGLRSFCDRAYRASSRVSLWLDESEDYLRFCHRGSLPRELPGQVEMTWWALGVMTTCVRQFLGPRWVPTRIGVPAQNEAGPIAREFFANAQLIPEPEHAWIELPRQVLATPPRPVLRALSRGASDPREPTDDFLGELRLLLRSYLPDGTSDINFAAELAGTSVRTFQRRLAAHGRTFARLVQESRFELARELLQVPGTRVIDVAYEVGFDDPSHFARAFRRLAGVTPREYRRTVSAEGH